MRKFLRIKEPLTVNSMDRYLKSTRDTNLHYEYEFMKLGQSVCVFGKSGIGKSWAVRDALNPAIELTYDILKSKQGTIAFLEKVAGSSLPVILDEYECVHELIGLREITRPPSSGMFVVTSQIPVKFSFNIETYDFPVKSREEILQIIPMASDSAITDSKGDLRYVVRSLNFKGDAVDAFQSPRDFVSSLVSFDSTVNPSEFIGHQVQEPGNVASILHENYVDATSCDFAKIVDYLSWADILEGRVYSGDWGVYPYYNLYGCILPAREIGHTLKPDLRPGSTWTKYQNMCLRNKRVSSILNRNPKYNLTFDSLLLLRSFAERGESALLLEYGIEPSDIDVMNHLSPLTKIKAKTVSILKKCLTPKSL